MVHSSLYRPTGLRRNDGDFVVGFGFYRLSKIGVDLYPKIDPPVVTVTTLYPGAGPEEVETLISKKIEEEVNQIGGTKRIVSTSQQGISRVVIEFNLEVNAQSAQNEVRDKVLHVRGDLPTDVEEPLIERLDFGDRPILSLALTAANEDAAKSYSAAMMRIIADDQVKPFLQKVSGVGQINLFGGEEREIEILVDRVLLQSHMLNMSEISEAIKRSNVNTPSGEVDEYPSRRSLRVMGEFTSPTEISEVIIKTLPGGQIIRVGDVAKVRDGIKQRTTLARLNGKNVVLLEVKKQSDANTVEVAENVVKQMDKVATVLPTGLVLDLVYDAAHMIRMSVHDVFETIGIAAVLAIIVVYFFLGSLQSTLITGLALPCTVIATFFVLNIQGFTLNMMTLLGLTLSVGLILDDAIVIRENIWNKIEQGLGAKEAAFVGTKEVMVAVLATSLTVLAVFFPVTFIPGIVGRFLSAFAFTVCIGIVLSTFDAITMAPMLSANLMRTKPGEHKAAPGKFMQRVNAIGGMFANAYSGLLNWCLNRPKITIGVAVLFFFSSIFLMRFVGFTFLPDNEAGEIQITLETAPGTSFNRMTEVAQKAEQIVRDGVPESLRISTRVGNDTNETNYATIYLAMVHYSDRKRSTSDVKNALRYALRPLAESEKVILGIGNPGGGGQGKPVTMVVQGPDNKVLQTLSTSIINEIQTKVPAVTNLDSNLKPGRQELQLEIDRTNAAAFGLRVKDIGENVRGFYEGLLAGVFREAGEEYDIRVRIRDDQRGDIVALEGMTMPSDRGDAVPLRSVARQRMDSSPTSIVRIDQRRSARIDGDLVPGAPLANAIDEIKKIITPLMPAGYTFNFQGQAESLADLKLGAISALGLGALFIYMVMASLYESFVMPIAILVTLPLAIIGAILGLLVTGKLLDIYGVIGIILLMALVTKNAILLVDYAEQLKAEGETTRQAIFHAGVRRMRPIIMTSIAMIAGMLPVAVGYGELNKVRAGMGIATIGGLISSTALSLIVIPCVYIFLDHVRTKAQKIVQRFYFGKKNENASSVVGINLPISSDQISP